MNKVGEEKVACATSLVLAVAKLITALWTGSLALLASALDSLMDFFVSGINLFSLVVAERPADEDHAYGHGKAEAIAGLFQSLFILGSAGALLSMSLMRLGGRSPLRHLEGGLGMVLLSLGVGLWLTRRLSRAAAATGSIVLKTDSLHYAMDLYLYGGILVSFVLIRLTGWVFLDPLASSLIAVYIGFLALKVGKKAIDELMDREASPELKKRVLEIIHRHRPEVIGMHNFKSRHAAAKTFVQFHIEVQRDLPFESVHELEERIAGEIRREMGNVHVTIHADPEGHGLDQTDLM